MAFNYDYLMGLPPRETLHEYSERDTLLYALGIGAGQDQEHYKDELPYIYETNLLAFPTMAVVLAYPGFWQKELQYGIHWQKVLHAEQSIEIHATLPSSGKVRGELVIDEIIDKGADKGAVLYSTRRIYDTLDNRHLATVRSASFCRGNGGFSSEGPQPSRKPHAIPNRDPELTIEMTTRLEQALVYRLSGDLNPLHADPAIADGAGFQRPILHGLCTYGVAGRAVLRALCQNDASRLRRLDVRFSSPTYPGDTIVTEIWREEGGKALFRSRAKERDVVVLNNGYAEYEVV